MNDICFEKLCGKHTFSGCELTSEDMEGIFGTESCGVCLFTLDGVTYKAIEDPDDGYRSYCRDLAISERKPKCSFPAIEVICSMREDDGYVLVIRDAENGKTVLQVGTCSTDDYYPYCVFDYTPENMACNQCRKSKKKGLRLARAALSEIEGEAHTEEVKARKGNKKRRKEGA